jgi:FKBP-type peptidyl-prolyl cis-trans isomerase
MKKLLTLATLAAVSFSKLSEQLIEKYSIEILNEGDEGTEPNVGDQVEMHYDGTLTDGTKFDSSYDRGQPLPLRIGRGQVIKCWDEVGVNLNVNQKVRVVCPSDTAYGSRAIGPIPANSDLVFVIERVK